MPHKVLLDVDDDDSIWAICICGWEKDMGYRPSAQVVQQVAQFHLDRSKSPSETASKGISLNDD